ncbi:MAG: hypothetical protein ACKKMV_02630 [Candidatus Nealsonbacteria bacterium]
MAKRAVKIKIIIEGFKNLFDFQGQPLPLKFKKGLIYVPDRTSLRDRRAGLKLKDNVGFITIKEIVKGNRCVGYVYRFCSSEYECLTYRESDNIDDRCRDFSFHYQKCEDNTPHDPHVSVLYPSIRYHSREIGLKEFLFFIKETFFTPEGTRKKDPIWCNRFEK